MKRLFLLIALLIVTAFLTQPAQADSIALSANSTGVSVIEQDALSLQVLNTLATIQTAVVRTDAGTFTRLQPAGYVTNRTIGQPELPVKNELIEVPYGAEIHVTVINYTVETIALAELGLDAPIYPAQPSLSKSVDPAAVPFEYEAAAYALNQFTNRPLATVEEVGMMRGHRLARLSLAPIQYNPVSHTLKVYNHLEVAIEYRQADLATTTWLREKYYSPVFESSFSQLLNYEPVATRDLITTYPIKYVILSDPLFEDALQPFIAWKKKKGFTVVEAYKGDPEVGSTRDAMKAYLQGLYDNATPADPAPTFLLIVGDVAQIPAYQMSGHVSDMYYCEYDGNNDFVPEIYYGRFSAETVAQLQPQIDKTLEYEQYLFPDESFLGEVVMVAGMDSGHGATHGNGQINYGTTYYFNAGHNLLSHTYLYPASGSNSAAIQQHVSDGVAFVNYTAHGYDGGWADPSFTVADVANLENDHEYPLMIANACLTNKFEVPTCFGEALLRAEMKGALGAIGGSNSTYWDEDFWWGVGVGTVTANPTYEGTSLGAYDRTFHDHGEDVSEWHITQGSMFFAGNMAVMEGASTNNARYYWEIYHLMGDPSVMIYMGIPAEMNPVFLPSIPIGSSTLTVNAEPQAYVALSMNGEQLDAQLTDASGAVTLNFPTLTNVGNADLVITKQNRQPFIGTVTIIPNNTPYVVFNSMTIDDSGANANGQVDCGETVSLNMTLENVGTVGTTGVTATLSTTDFFVSLVDDEADFGDFDPESSNTIISAFEFTVMEVVPDQHSVHFDLTATDDNGEVWTSGFNVVMNAPVLEIGAMTIDDSQGGNGDGKLDAGEIVFVRIPSYNTGHSDALESTASLMSGSSYVTINNNTYNLNTIPAEDFRQASFEVVIAEETPMGTSVDFTFMVSCLASNADFTFYKTVGIIDESFETGDLLGFEWVTDSWSVVQVTSFEGDYCAQSGTIDHNGETYLELTINCLANSDISFYRKVSSENNYDYLRFSIDGVEQGAWAGEMDWEQVTYPIQIGERVLRWSYTKDGSVSNGSDCGWIDMIVFPPMAFGFVAPTNIAVEQHTNYLMLTWDAIVGYSGLIGYNVYENGVKINNNVVPVNQYMDRFFEMDVEYCYTVTGVYNQGESMMSPEFCFTPTIIGIEDDIAALPEFFAVSQNFPNPFNPATTINFQLPQPSQVSLKIYNATGQLVKTLVHGEQPAGYFTETWNGTNDNGQAVGSGVYYYRLKTDHDFDETRTMLLLK